MRILAIADEECKALWDYFTPDKLAGVDLIIACGDLNRHYLEYLATMAPMPVLYVHGNHDESYDLRPPQGVICIDDEVYVHNGLRIAGLGGGCRYRTGAWQFTEAEMKKRVNRLRGKMLHGHIHLSYGASIPREQQYGTTRIVNCYERVYLDAEPPAVKPRHRLFASLLGRSAL